MAFVDKVFWNLLKNKQFCKPANVHNGRIFANLSSKNQPDCQLMPQEVSLPRARDSQLSSIPQVHKSLAQVLHGYRPLCTGGQCFQLMFGIQTTGSSWKCPHLTFQLGPSCHCFPPPLAEKR